MYYVNYIIDAVIAIIPRYVRQIITILVHITIQNLLQYLLPFLQQITFYLD